MCRLIRERIAGRPAELATDELIQAAAQRWIQVIGEAAANVSPELRAAHPEVQWRGSIGMRNILVHGYFHLDLDVMGEVIERDLPELERQIQTILAELE